MSTILLTLDSLAGVTSYLEKSFEMIQKLQGENVLLLDILDTTELELAEAQDDDFLPALEKSKEAALEALLAQLQTRYPEVAIEASLQTGNPKRKIIDEAKRLNAELVISGSHQYSNLEYLLSHGSVAAYLAKHLPCDLLILKGEV